MKYSFTAVQPAPKASLTVRRISSSVRFLLMASRSRCVPASGAKVRPAAPQHIQASGEIP